LVFQRATKLLAAFFDQGIISALMIRADTGSLRLYENRLCRRFDVFCAVVFMRKRSTKQPGCKFGLQAGVFCCGQIAYLYLVIGWFCALSSVVEHYLHTTPLATRNAPQIDEVSRVFHPTANILSNKVSNTPRFQRVERGLQRHVRTGELWFVGRRCGKVVWQRLGTPVLRVARATVAMIESNLNGNHEILLVVDGKTQPLASPVAPAVPDQPLRRVREVLVDADSATPPSKPAPAVRPAASGPVPTLEELIVRCRRGKNGLKRGTLKKLDAHLTMMRRYVDTHRPVTEYRAQDIRDFWPRRGPTKEGPASPQGPDHQPVRLAAPERSFCLGAGGDHIPRNPMDSVKREKAEPIIRTQLKWADAERFWRTSRCGETRSRIWS
jgi:hypothetical protein